MTEEELPIPTSLYRYFNEAGELLYVGITSRGLGRNLEHARSKPWWPLVERSTVEHFPSREAARMAETAAIQDERPRFNRTHGRTRSGHLRQRGPDTWQVIVTLPKDPFTGQQRQLTRTVHGSRADAMDEKHRMLVEVAQGKHPNRSGTLTELVEAWLDVSGHEESTLVTERADLRRYIVPTIGKRQVRTLQPVDLTAFYVALRRKGGTTEQGLSSSTVDRVHALIRRALAYGVELEWCSSNPAATARQPKAERIRLTPPSPVDLIRLLDAAAADDPAWGAFLRLLATTGARRGELCALRWRHVDLERSYIVIDEAVGVGTDGLYLKDTKTDRRRVVPIGASSLAVLREHRSAAVARLATLGRELDPASFVFTRDPAGTRPWRPGTVTNRFGRLAKELGITCRLHDLRHFVGTNLIDGGIPVTAVSAYLGHDRASTTTDIYGHALDPSLTAGADLIDRLLS